MPTARRRIFFLTAVGLISLLAAWMVGNQTTPAPGGKWSPRALSGRGRITASANPIEPPQSTVQSGEADAEMLAGPWETDDPFSAKPSQMGIFLAIYADHRPAYHQGKVTIDAEQRFASLDIRLYQRAAGEDKGGWFSTADDGGASWDGHRLRIGSNGVGSGIVFQGELGLDLTFDAQKSYWRGSYTRRGVTRPVQLPRPGTSREVVSSPFVGGWSERDRVEGLSCVHIAQGADGTFVAWRDARIGPVKGPKSGIMTGTIQETDGEALGIQLVGDTLTLREGIFGGVIAGQRFPEKFIGKLSRDDKQIIGNWGPSYRTPEQPYRYLTGKLTTLKKMVGKSCWSQVAN